MAPCSVTVRFSAEENAPTLSECLERLLCHLNTEPLEEP